MTEDIWEKFAKETAAAEAAERHLDEEDKASPLSPGSTNPVDFFVEFEEWKKKSKAIFDASTKARAALATELMKQHFENLVSTGAINRPINDGETVMIKGDKHSVEVKCTIKDQYDQDVLREIDLMEAAGANVGPPAGLSVKYGVNEAVVTDPALLARIHGALTGAKSSLSFKSVPNGEDE